jgi:hypothetical protein
MLSLSLSYSAQAPVSSDKNKDLTIKVRDGCFFTVPVSELIEYANVGALLTTILELAAKEGQAVTDPERAEDCSILLNGDKELITAKTAFESRLIDRIRCNGEYRFAASRLHTLEGEGGARGGAALGR